MSKNNVIKSVSIPKKVLAIFQKRAKEQDRSFSYVFRKELESIFLPETVIQSAKSATVRKQAKATR